ncbi:hypothetical protein MAR_019246 [Mya arenaria]|uniref:Uncharacterized protein n=1 Tax=Mya arenaria TaxID=6604 RepID=A0ABY7EH09_MYAAR|nr:hypothetical protein MAR_019246 [Mya arenaria]
MDARQLADRESNDRLSYSPLITRRPATSFVSRQAFSPAPRIHSAQSRVAMTATPRTQVSMAGFYDWSTEEFEDSTMPTFYQKIAVNHKGKMNKANKAWCADGIHLNPGRMFIRDKANLTKGEREIIAGICKNRGDTKTNFVAHVKSHKDAWLVGRQAQRGKPGHNSDSDKCSIKIPENLFSRIEPPAVHSDRSYFCDKCKEDCTLTDHCRRHKYDVKNDVIGRKAPPTSPELSPATERRIPKNPKTNEGAVFVESGKTFYDVNEGAKKKKVYVDVFLPKFPTQGLQEEAISLTLPDNDRESARSSKINSNSQPKLFKISERSPEHTDEGYSSQERSPSNTKQMPYRALLSRSSGKPESGCDE